MLNVLGKLIIIRVVTRVHVKDSADVFEMFDNGRGWDTCSFFTVAARNEFNYSQDRLRKSTVKYAIEVTYSETQLTILPCMCDNVF